MNLSRNHIIHVLGINIPLNESVGEMNPLLREEIIRRQLIYESFLDSMKNFAKEKWNQAITTIKDWKDAASVLGKIITNPTTLDSFIGNFWKSFKNNNLKRFTAILQQWNLSNFIPSINAIIDKITAMKGWQKFMAATAIAAITTYILNKIKGFTVEGLKKWITSYFSDSIIGTITSKLTDFTSYIGWLQPIVQGVGVIYDVLKDHINKFKNALVPQATNENIRLKKAIRRILSEEYEDRRDVNENWKKLAVTTALGAALFGSPMKGSAQDTFKDRAKEKIKGTVDQIKNSDFIQTRFGKNKEKESKQEIDSVQAEIDSLMKKVGVVEKVGENTYGTYVLGQDKNLNTAKFIAMIDFKRILAQHVKSVEVSPGNFLISANIGYMVVDDVVAFKNDDGEYLYFMKAHAKVE